jgi:hypothetical protein
MLTVDTITDEQVIEATAFDPRVRETNAQLIRLRAWALEPGHVQRYAARARCVEILNARFRHTEPT